MKFFLVLATLMIYLTVVINQHNSQYAAASTIPISVGVEVIEQTPPIELPTISTLYHKWIEDVRNINPTLPNWPASMPKDVQQQVICLALNMYHEARGSSVDDMAAVGNVTMNRVADSRWKDSICDVVWQKNQFSWTFLKTTAIPKEKDSWIQAQTIALLISYQLVDDNTNGANHYHATYVQPAWSNSGEDKIHIGDHIYMKIH